jgi:outer membrane immunogenic protein
MSPVSTTINSRGWIGGLQGGWNYQIGRLVVGVEYDWNWAGLNGSSAGASLPSAVSTGVCVAQPPAGPCVSPVADAFAHKTDWYATASTRIGIAQDRWFFYSKIGAAFDHNKYTQNVAGAFFPASSVGFTAPFVIAGTASDNRVGWTVGTGLEWAFLGNLSAKIEYDYMNFGSKTVVFNNTAIVAPGLLSGGQPALAGAYSAPLSVNIHQQISVVKFGINYRFLPSI